ncbi:hypothetical protein [Candidatus Poriferisodalis sp.]|uniref:hypothetical protein n=1 Tax=Candidatus Poriferisodalis sp. TaxID=3101277 RepID=UPI003C6F1E52
MTLEPMGWAGFANSDNPLIRAFGLWQLLVIGAISLSLESVLANGDHRYSVALIVIGAMLAYKGLAPEAPLSDNDPAGPRSHEIHVLMDRVSVLLLLLWLAYATIQIDWLTDHLRLTAIMLTVARFVTRNRICEAYAVLKESVDNPKPAPLHLIWHETKKTGLRTLLFYAAIPLLAATVHLAARFSGHEGWLSPSSFIASLIFGSVAYQCAVIALFGRSAVHALASERVVSVKTRRRPPWAVSAIRSLAFNAPLILTGLLLAVDVIFFGANPGLNIVLEVLGTLALLYYGVAYLHRDRRAIYDIIAGTMVLRSDLTLTA